MEKTVSSWALVTGASTGIGLELARVLIQNGCSTILVSSNGERLANALDELQKEKNANSSTQQKIISIEADLSKADADTKLYTQISQQNIQIDILVNNAGVPVCGRFANTDLKEEKRMLRLNMENLTGLTKLFLPNMLKKRHGRILNVASVAAYFPGPNMAAYFATKAYVLSLSEALHHELKGTGVTCTALCPGATDTRFMERGGVENSGLTKQAMMHPCKVAIAGYKGMLKGKRVVVPGALNKMIVGMGKHTPRGMNAKMVEKMVTGRRGRSNT